MVDRMQSSSLVDGPYDEFDDGLNSAASTIASIVSRQAFDIPRTDRDGAGDVIGSAGDRRSAGGRFSLPDIIGPGDGGKREQLDSDASGVRARRDSVGSGVRTRRDDTQANGRDPFGSPVTPKTYNGFRYHADNTRVIGAAAAVNTFG